MKYLILLRQMHFTGLGEGEGATKEGEVHRENRKITGGRKRELLLPEKLEYWNYNTKLGNGIRFL